MSGELGLKDYINSARRFCLQSGSSLFLTLKSSFFKSVFLINFLFRRNQYVSILFKISKMLNKSIIRCYYHSSLFFLHSCAQSNNFNSRVSSLELYLPGRSFLSISWNFSFFVRQIWEDCIKRSVWAKNDDVHSCNRSLHVI